MATSIEAFKRLEILVTKNQISYYALSKQLEIPSSFFSEWKRGKMMPKVDKLKILADYFGVTIEYFLE